MSNMSNTSKRNSAFRGGKFSAAIFSFLAIFLFAAFPGAASAQNAARQILQLTLSPSNGVIDLADEVTQSDCVGRAAASAPLDCPVVRVTPRFSRTSDRPSVPTIVKILPITPIITTTGVVARGETTFTLNQAAKDRTAETKKALDAAWAALSAARTAIKDANFVGRGATPAEIRARRDTWRAYLRAEKAHHAALTAAALGVTRHAKNVQVYKSDGTIRQQVKPDAPKFRPDGYVPVSGDQYAVYGEDYFLTDGHFVVKPDGTFDPPYFEVRALKKDAPRDLTAMFGLYVSTGDKKYNRPAAQGGSAAEFAVKLKAPDKTLPTVEVALVSKNLKFTPGGDVFDPVLLNTVQGGLIREARLVARLITPAGGVPVAAESAIHLKLPRLPIGLVRGLRASAPSTLTLSASNTKVYQPLQDTLTIPAGRFSAATGVFIIYPSTYAGEYKLAAPVIVDAAGNPLKNTGMTASGRVVTVEKATRTGFTSLALPSAAERLRAEEPLADRYQHGALAPAALTATLDGITGPVYIHTHHVEVRVRADDTTGANSADFTDFMKRNPDGSFSPLTAAQFPDTYIPPVQLARYDRYFRVPIFPRDDRLVEGEETFKVRLNENDSGEKVATIPANGAATLKVGYTAADGGGVSGELELSGENFGIAVGSGGSVVFENSDSSLQLEFTDTTGRDGSGAADGILSGDELSTTATWTFNSAQLALAVDSANLPANLQASQFPGATLPALPDAPPVVGFTEATALTVTESGATSDPVMQLQITPPLNKPATLEIVAIGKVGGNSLTATAAGEEFADVHAALEVQLPAGGGFDDPAVRVVEFPVSHVKDDLIVEPDETFQLALRVRPDDPFVIGGNTTRTITIKDDDTATFTVEASPVGQLRRGGTVTLTGRLSAALQVSGVIIGSDTSAANLSFSDGNSDGYISGAELSGVTTSLTVDSLLNGAEYNYSYSAIAPGSGLRDEAFLFPQRGDPGRAHLRWHANGLFALPKIAPRHAPGDHTFAGVIRINEGGRAIRGADGTRGTLAAMSATVPVSLDYDYDDDNTEDDVVVVVTAHYDADGEGGSPSRSVSKEVTFTSAENATTAKNAQFTAADFNALGIRDDEMINRNRVLTTTIAFDTAAQRITKDTVTVFSDQSIRGPDILIEDDDSVGETGPVNLHLTLVGADGRAIPRLQAGKRADAFLMAEIHENGNAAAKVAVENALSVGVGLAAGDGLLTRAELGNPDLPRGILIRPGESSGLSARAFSITPDKQGASFAFAVRSLAPPQLGAFNAGSFTQVRHNVGAPGAKSYFATLDATDVTVNEGDTGLTAAVTLRDAASGLPAAFSRAGSGETLTLHYAIGMVAGGAASADLSLGTASSTAAPPPCARCADVFGAPLTTGSVEIASGATTASIGLPGIVDDAAPEAAEKFTLALTAITDSNGLPPVENGAQTARIGLADAAADYTIAASDGGSQTEPAGPALSATPLVVLQEGLDEDASAAELRANVSEGFITLIRPADSRGAIRGRVRAVNVTADGGADYEIGDTFEIGAGEYSTSLAVRALADDITERNESFQVEFLVTDGNARAPASATEVVILDNDRPVTLEVKEATVSVEENQLLEITVQAKQGSDPAPLRESPVEFILTPTYPASGAASAADFLVTIGGETRAAASDAELTVTGVLEPGETEASVSFPVIDDGDTADEMVTFTVSLPPGNTVNTLDGAISIGSSAATTATLTAATDGAPNTLVLTPTTLTRVYGEAEPTEFAFTVAPQTGSAFDGADTAATTFFDTNPLELVDSAATAGTYAFKLADTPDYATGVDAKYDFVLAKGVTYTITPKEIIFTGAGINKVYDGSVFAPEFLGTFTSGLETDDLGKVHARGGVYAGKDAGTGKTITGFGLGGEAAGNYALASASAAAGDITARDVGALRFVVDAQAPSEAALNTLTPVINRANIFAAGVVPAELDDFRAGLRFTAAYATTPTSRGVHQPVTVTLSGNTCADASGQTAACGLADSGDFKAANYSLGATSATASGLIAGVPGAPAGLQTSRSPDARHLAVSWNAPASAGVPNADIAKYYVRWRTVAIEADAAAGVAALAAGDWQNASGPSDLGENVGAKTGYTIRGLRPDAGYDVQVAAENEFGANGRGAYAEADVSAGVPPAPVITSLAPSGARQFSIAFTAPLVAAGGETTPLYAWRPIGVEHTGNEWLQPTSVSPRTARTQNVSPSVTATGEVQYEVRMALRNDFGRGAWSESRFVTPPAGNPAGPPGYGSSSRGDSREVSAYSHGGPNIDVSWTPPAGVNLSRPIGRYELRWKLQSATTFADSDKTTLQADGRNVRNGRNAYVIRNLTTGVYGVDLRACNASECNTWFAARDPGHGTAISTGHGLGNSDTVNAVEEMIVPHVEALQIGDRSLTVNWRPPLYADGTAIDYGFPITTYRVRWRHGAGTDTRWRNPNGAGGEAVVNPDPASSARRSHTITGLENGIGYQVEFWSERQRENAAGDAKVEAYISATGKRWSDYVTALRASGSPAENAVFLPRVVMTGIPQGAQPDGVPELADLRVGARALTIAASWSAPDVPSGNSVNAYQIRWRPEIAGARKKNWQTADLAATARAYTIAAYTRDDPKRPALREIPYEAQVRSRHAPAGGENVWSAWSPSKSITPPAPFLSGMHITAAADSNSAAGAFVVESAPKFAAGVFSYAVEIPNDAGVAWLTPRAPDGRTVAIGPAGRRGVAVAAGAQAAVVLARPGEVARVEVKVTATVGAATSENSYIYVIRRAGDPPGPPVSAELLPGPFDLEFIWGAPSDSGETFANYRARWRVVGAPARGRVPARAPGAWQPDAEGRDTGLARRTIIANLQPGTTYEAQVRAFSTAGLAGQWSPPVSASPRAFTFDVDGSGASDSNDSILVGRYLIGVRGAALTGGLTLPDGADAGEIAAGISVGVRDNRFDVDRDGRSSAQDGIMIMRYAFGVTSGAGLTEGQTNEDAANVAETIGDLQQ